MTHFDITHRSTMLCHPDEGDVLRVDAKQDHPREGKA